MGEAKRRKQQDPDWGQHKEGLSSTYIDPSFDLLNFDFDEPHTVVDWQSFFFSINPESREVDAIPNRVLRINLHSKAFAEYIRRKVEKGMVLGDELPVLRIYN